MHGVGNLRVKNFRLGLLDLMIPLLLRPVLRVFLTSRPLSVDRPFANPL
jgi:hypothetical protein